MSDVLMVQPITSSTHTLHLTQPDAAMPGISTA
ncbi:hypothetical protein LPU83_pLPU83d_1326 (plasmid) [Rhizobium favelukesii]|uniref:Uncharacterized protein n=1 Tax=Rhizobium favelukesii TaxID=348824 RepID=W6S990_9HYPH|nr:hypothetical protein LPU83_pLPU83d_1326 [Rhizobium favelukesii]